MQLFTAESELFRSAPRTCHGDGGRLTMRRTDCEGGSPRVRYTTARFRHPAWLRHDSGVAAYGERAATAGDAGDRVPRFGFAPTNGTDGSCVSPGPGQSRLRRGPERGDRIPLGRFSIRAIAGARRGVSPPSSGRDLYRRFWQPDPRGKGGHLDDSDRLRVWGRSGERRPRGQPKPPRG